MSLSPGLLNRFSYNKIFVETGTGNGDGVQAALNAGFEYISSWETNEQLFRLAHDRFRKFISPPSPSGDIHVFLYLGDSSIFLPIFLRAHPRDPITFWLDAHVMTGQEKSALAKKNCPLLDELEAIAQCRQGQDTILIDDIRYFKRGYERWEGITLAQIIEKLTAIVPNFDEHYVIKLIDGAYPDDILVAEPRQVWGAIQNNKSILSDNGG